MSESKLDQLVKGAPAPDVSLPAVASSVAANPPSPSLAAAIQESQRPVAQPPSQQSDTAPAHPSSPPQIYLNLLILEASLRSQYLALHARRRQHTFFLLLLTLWLAYFTWALFLRPRDDGRGHGGSVYWVVDMYEKVSFLGGVLTAILIWATGTWDRGVRWPRRWAVIANRGLRVMNLKVVVLKGPWWTQPFSYLGFLIPHRSYFLVPSSSYRYVPIDPSSEKPSTNTSAPPKPTPAYRTTRHTINQPQAPPQNYVEEDIFPGGDHVKLLLLPKQFSAEFRQNWELFRTEYWEKENERRAGLRKGVWKRERDEARRQGGWLWWTGWRGWGAVVGGGARVRRSDFRVGDVEKTGRLSGAAGGRESSVNNKARWTGSAEPHSRSSSRSSNASNSPPDPDSQGQGRSGSVGGRRPSLTKAKRNSSKTVTPTSPTAAVFNNTRHSNSFSSVSSASSSSSFTSRTKPPLDTHDSNSSELSDTAAARRSTATATMKMRKMSAEGKVESGVSESEGSGDGGGVGAGRRVRQRDLDVGGGAAEEG